jgi:hypothetical protein
LPLSRRGKERSEGHHRGAQLAYKAAAGRPQRIRDRDHDIRARDEQFLRSVRTWKYEKGGEDEHRCPHQNRNHLWSALKKAKKDDVVENTPPAPEARLDPGMISVKEAASRLVISVSKMYEIKAEVGFYRIGGIKFDPQDVKAYKQRCKVTAEQPILTLPSRLKHLSVTKR